MEWTPNTIAALRRHLNESAATFSLRLGLSRPGTIYDWESGRSQPIGMACKLFDYIADDVGFTEKVARRIREKMT